MNKTIFLFLCFYLFLNRDGRGQCNLVPNPGFEIDTNCTNGIGGILFGFAPPWNSPTLGSPDLYNTCSPNSSGSSVPFDVIGFQQPHSGNGYAGFATFDPTYHNNREYIQVELDSTLVNHGEYCVSFYVNLADSVGIGNNNIGIYFSETATSISGYSYLYYIPQINDTNIISDTLNWTEISGTYIAQGGERYIIIGNFYPDLLTDTVGIHTTTPWTHRFGYYYIDDISVHRCTCSETGINVLSTSNEITISPNPFTSQTTITFSEAQKNTIIKVVNVLGQCIQQLTTSNQQLRIDMSGQAKGTYFVQITNEKGNMVNRKVVVE